jgi:hypothetical protein
MSSFGERWKSAIGSKTTCRPRDVTKPLTPSGLAECMHLFNRSNDPIVSYRETYFLRRLGARRVPFPSNFDEFVLGAGFHIGARNA